MNSSFLVSANFVVMSQIVLLSCIFREPTLCFKIRLFKQILNTFKNYQHLKSMKGALVVKFFLLENLNIYIYTSMQVL